jgi:hypothetical protein
MFSQISRTISISGIPITKVTVRSINHMESLPIAPCLNEFMGVVYLRGEGRIEAQAEAEDAVG